MSLNKKSMVREIGRRTRLTNRDVQAVIETLIDVWTEELVSGGRIELEGFCTLTIQRRERIHPRTKEVLYRSRVLMRAGKHLQARLRDAT